MCCHAVRTLRLAGWSFQAEHGVLQALKWSGLLRGLVGEDSGASGPLQFVWLGLLVAAAPAVGRAYMAGPAAVPASKRAQARTPRLVDPQLAGWEPSGIRRAVSPRGRARPAPAAWRRRPQSRRRTAEEVTAREKGCQSANDARQRIPKVRSFEAWSGRPQSRKRAAGAGWRPATFLG